jgi:hypothetical protein
MTKLAYSFRSPPVSSSHKRISSSHHRSRNQHSSPTATGRNDSPVTSHLWSSESTPLVRDRKGGASGTTAHETSDEPDPEEERKVRIAAAFLGDYTHGRPPTLPSRIGDISNAQLR